MSEKDMDRSGAGNDQAGNGQAGVFQTGVVQTGKGPVSVTELAGKLLRDVGGVLNVKLTSTEKFAVFNNALDTLITEAEEDATNTRNYGQLVEMLREWEATTSQLARRLMISRINAVEKTRSVDFAKREIYRLIVKENKPNLAEHYAREYDLNTKQVVDEMTEILLSANKTCTNGTNGTNGKRGFYKGSATILVNGKRCRCYEGLRQLARKLQEYNAFRIKESGFNLGGWLRYHGITEDVQEFSCTSPDGQNFTIRLDLEQ